MLEKTTFHFPDSFTDEQFYEFCLANRDLQIERNEEGEIEFMAAAGGETGASEALLIARVYQWNEHSKLGIVFSPTTGFILKKGAMRQPDAAWISIDRWNTLADAQKKKFIPISPDFVIELRSSSDSLAPLQEKMKRWIQNGVKLGWLIDPQAEKSYIYRKNKKPVVVKGFDKTLSGENVLVGFELDLKELKS